MKSVDELDKLKTYTDAFMRHVYFVQQKFDLLPDKEHYGACINYIDLQEVKSDFCNELINTISEWIYSNSKAAKILEDLRLQGRSLQNASSELQRSTFAKFRNRGSNKNLIAQGQFGELLLFNFLQVFFNAIPLIRKMPLTTSSEMERFGADAIHYTRKLDKNIIVLGEAKTYTASYKFPVAFKDALDSITKTYKNHRNELDLYIYDDFIDDHLIDIAKAYKNGTLSNVEVQLVCIITYNETDEFAKGSESEIKTAIVEIIKKRTKSINKDVFDKVDAHIQPRLNYIIFPVWELDKLIEEFQRNIGK